MNDFSPLSLATPLRYWPDENHATTEDRPIRRWRVLHAFNGVGSTPAVAEAQIETGMHPSLLTPRGWFRPLRNHQRPATALSLVHEWQQVRRWRQRFLKENVDQWAEVLHAHCFAAAMAGLRGNTPVVYDLVAPLGAGIVPRPGTWLLRSLRVAEQFALARSGAVVTHSQAMWSEALQRGVDPADLFLVPDPVELAELDWPPERRRDAAITLFAPSVGGADVACAPSRVHDAYQLLLQAFAILVSEIERARLLLEVAPGSAEPVMALASHCGVAAGVDIVYPGERPRALSQSDIVIALAPPDDSPGGILLSALAHGRAVLAADVAQHREVTPQGRGCLWFRKDDARDLAGRAAFLARNADFRAALAISGRAHLQATRNGKVIARKYDDVYRHAYQRRYRGGPDALGKLQIVQACF